jgi:hypothetical protein
MSDIKDNVRDKIRRTITHEFIRLEDDYDETRTHRDKLIAKIMNEVDKVSFVDDGGRIDGNAKSIVTLYGTALKALNEKERAQGAVINLKLRQAEQEAMSAAAAKDRIAIVLKATAPGAITETFPSEDLETALDEMFGKDIKDFELKTNPRDLSD